MGYIESITESGEREGSLKLKGLARRYVRKYEVITSDQYVGSLQVELADLGFGVRIPRLGEPYVVPGWSDLGAIVTEVIPRQPEVDVPTYWTVEVIYESLSSDPTKQSGSGGGGGQPGSPQTANPLLEKPKVLWGTRKINVAKLRTVDDLPYSQEKAIANSAGTPYDPPPTVPKPFRTLKITRNEVDFRPFTTKYFIECVNQDTFQNQDPGCALCEDITGEEAYKDGFTFWVVTYEFLFGDHHDIEFIDKGPSYLTEYDGERRSLKPFTTSTGMHAGEGLLDGNGNPLPRNPVTGVYTAKPVELRFPLRFRNRFADLKLPDPAY